MKIPAINATLRSHMPLLITSTFDSYINSSLLHKVGKARGKHLVRVNTEQKACNNLYKPSYHIPSEDHEWKSLYWGISIKFLYVTTTFFHYTDTIKWSTICNIKGIIGTQK